MGMVPDEPVLTAWNTLLAEFGNHHRFEGYGLIGLTYVERLTTLFQTLSLDWTRIPVKCR